MNVILLGAGGTGTAFALASRIKANWGAHVRIVVTDIHPAKLVTTSLIADAFYQTTYASDSKFKAVIKKILLSEGATTYIPILNEELAVAAELMRDGDLSHIDFWASELYSALRDKAEASAWLNGLGVRTPRPVNWRDGSEGNGPWFAKPLDGLGSKGARSVVRHELESLSEQEASSLFVQELCEGPEVTVDSFFDWRAEKGFSCCRERLEVKSGVCTKARLFYDPELDDFSKRIGQNLHQRGTICFQVMKYQGSWVVTDLNLRSGAGTAMTCAAGYDVLSAAYACRQNQEYWSFLSGIPINCDVYVTRQYSEFIMS